MINKTKNYRLEDGTVIAAASVSEFVTELRKSSLFDSHLSDHEYMKGFAHRQNVMTGAIVRTDTTEHFVDDLIEIGTVSLDT